MIFASTAFLLPHTVSAEVTHSILSFEDLDRWERDDHADALEVFRSTCQDIKEDDWQTLCGFAEGDPNPKEFFELFFRPVLIEDGNDPLFTGYFEPELSGSLTRTDRFQYPVYKVPREVRAGAVWLDRRAIVETGILEERGLEIAWVDDPVELFFLQIQGSGRIRLPDGSMIRVGYGAANGHEYRSIGVELVRRGIYKSHQVSAQVIQNWVRRNPEQGRELLFHNPSYVFFREVSEIAPEKGPLGAMNRSVTVMRSVAIDPRFVPLGAPVWIEKDGQSPFRRLMIAQDTGSAIKGAQRADIFFGTGKEAGRKAGRLRDPGRLIVLIPVDRAFAMQSDLES
ncbi:MAG: MltA domain-containing protein [Pseudomonadota bacterium]